MPAVVAARRFVVSVYSYGSPTLPPAMEEEGEVIGI